MGYGVLGITLEICLDDKANVVPFNKREVREMIEVRGGKVIDDFTVRYS